jgi:hypothetical protein
MLGDSRYDGHQVRFTCSIVAHDENALVVCGLAELQLREDEIAEHFSHSVRDDKCLDQSARIRGRVGLSELDNGFNWLELNELRIFHLCLPGRCRVDRFGVADADDRRLRHRISLMLRMARFRVSQIFAIKRSGPCRDDRSIARKRLEQSKRILCQIIGEQQLDIVEENDI